MYFKSKTILGSLAVNALGERFIGLIVLWIDEKGQVPFFEENRQNEKRMETRLFEEEMRPWVTVISYLFKTNFILIPI